MSKDYSYLLNEEERRLLTRKIAAEGFVLLKNDGGVLPFKNSDTIAVFGRTQIDTLKGGIGSSNMELQYDISILDGFENSSINIYKPLADKYKKWVSENPVLNFGIWGTGMPLNPEMPIEKSDAQSALEGGANKAVIVLGRMAGENTDVVLSHGDFYLSDEEEALFEAVCSVFSDVTVILNTTGIIDLSFIEKYGVKSVLYINMCGLDGGNAVADVMSGAITPSGKLTDTVAFEYSDYPSSNYFGQECGGLLQDYFEDIYVGYRYFETFDGMKERVRYPFGFGLSYTSFELSDFDFKEAEQEIFVSAKIQNIGNFNGKETLQVYFCPPLPCQGAKLYKSKMNLCGFAKTELLKIGESQTLGVNFKKKDMASFDDTGVTGYADCYVLEAGEYRIYAGTSVSDAENHLVGCFKVKETTVTEKCHHLPTALKERLLGNGETEALETIPVDVLEGVSVGIDEQEIDKSLYAFCDGGKTEYRFQIGTSGGYTLSLWLDSSLKSKPLCEILKLEVSGTEIDLEGICTDQNAEVQIRGIVLPIGRADFVLTSLCEYFDIQKMTIKKEVKVCSIPSKGSIKLEAADFFECAFRTGADRYTDINGKSGAYIYNLNRPSNFINYKLIADEAGIYEVKLSYSNSCKGETLNNIAAIFVSNVGQSIDNIEIKNTCKAGEFNFVLSDSIRITLPKGESYFKIVSASLSFPDLEYILIERSANQDKRTAKTSLLFNEISEDDFPDESTSVLIEPEVERRGIQLYEVYKDPNLMSEFLEQLSNEELATLVSGSAPNRTETGTTGTTSPLYDRGVTPVQTADGPMGLRLRTTSIALPSCTILASSFNTELAYEMGVSFGYEAKKHEIDCVLGPALNIHRDIRCGRNFEYFSEDPIVSGKFAAAVVNGLQSVGVSAMAKHYAANSCEHERLKSNSRISARALREIYLKGFEIVIKEAQPHSIMTSYNHVNNTKVCESYDLVTLIPRDEWGYSGVFATDWINDSIHVKELLAGHDLKMNEGDVDAVCLALENGTLSRERVKESAKRVLEFVMKSDYFKKKFNILD